jgi:hypothetical protein
MISNFKPAGRIAAAGSLALLLALGSLTFTRAADQTDTAANPDAAPANAAPPSDGVKDGPIRIRADKLIVDTAGLDKLMEGKTAGDTNLQVLIQASDADIIGQLEKILKTELEKNTTSPGRPLPEDAAVIEQLKGVISAMKEQQAGTITFVNGQKAALIRAGQNPGLDELSKAQLAQMQAQLAKAQADMIAATRTLTTHQLVILASNDFDRARGSLEENTRLAEAKLNYLRSLKETYAKDLAGHASDQSTAVARLNEAMADAEAQRARQLALLDRLRCMSSDELRQALPSTVPDAILTKLMQDELAAEAKLAEQRSSMGAENPEVTTTRKLIETLNEQIDERTKGLLAGLQAQADAATASIASIKEEINAVPKRRSEVSDLSSQIDRAELELQSLKSQLSPTTEDLKQQQIK